MGDQKSRLILEKNEKAHIELANVSASEIERLRVLREKSKLYPEKLLNCSTMTTKVENNLKEFKKANRKHDARSTWKIIKRIARKEKKRSIKVRSDRVAQWDGRLSSRSYIIAIVSGADPPWQWITNKQSRPFPEERRFNSDEQL